jgi:hypothetical protein
MSFSFVGKPWFGHDLNQLLDALEIVSFAEIDE